MDASSADRAKTWLVQFGCRKCAERGVTPTELAAIVRRPAGVWELRVRGPRIGLPRAGNEHDAQGYAWRFSELHPERNPEEVAARAAYFVRSPHAHKLKLNRDHFALAPKRGRFMIDCGRGHGIQTTAASLIRLADGAIAGGAEEATWARGLVRLRAAPLRPMPVFDPLRDANAFT
jgi:hypothetical protein